ncbi:MAG: ABC transporter permease [Alphaproteobacteria bacterium]|nr:ABC transporter permease [Alphaproteobacteria bacterium]
MVSGTARYLASRLVTTALIVIGAMVVLVGLTGLVPGNAADVLLGPQATPEVRAEFIRRMGLDRPVWERIALFAWAALQGDLGADPVSGRAVTTMLAEVLPFTIVLTVTAIGFAILVGVPLGCYAATHPGSRTDQILAVVSVAFIAVPSFVIAIYLLLIFSIWLDWLPVLGTGRSGDIGDQLKRLILPSLALSLTWIGYIARLMRTSLLEVLGEPFIRTNRAYGLSERLVIYKYALKNACIPTIAILGLGIGRLLGGAVFVEIIFARPGVGKLIYDAISGRNYPVVQGSVFVIVILFVLVNLLVDLSYSWIDPRIRADMARQSRPT